jgi:HEPN domain-containing protein
MKVSARQWLRKAEGDAVSAWRDYRARKHPNYDNACYHAQQSVEKCLKGALDALDLPVRRVHDLSVLLDECLPAHSEWSELRFDLELLSQYSVLFRYPGEDATREQARAALEAMDRCRAIILTDIAD